MRMPGHGSMSFSQHGPSATIAVKSRQAGVPCRCDPLPRCAGSPWSSWGVAVLPPAPPAPVWRSVAGSTGSPVSPATGSSAEPSDGTAKPTGSVPPAGVIVLHGTFTGHFADALATADQVVEVEVLWSAGPDDVHDRDAFTLPSGSFTFSQSIIGVCGGTCSEAGALTSFVNPQSLFATDPQVRDNVSIAVIDQRLAGSGVEFSVSSLFEVPSADPVGCGDLDRSGVGSCSLVFMQRAIGVLEPEATCRGAAGDWTGRLVP